VTECIMLGCPFRINGTSNPNFCARGFCQERVQYVYNDPSVNPAINPLTQIQTSFEEEARCQINELMQMLDKERSTLKLCETERDRLLAENRDLRNELCVLCGKFKREHEGACDGCRWKR